MGLWKIETKKTPNKIAVTYVNLWTGAPFAVGDQHPDTDVDLIIEWIWTEWDPGDVIIVNGVPVAHLLPEATA